MFDAIIKLAQNFGVFTTIKNKMLNKPNLRVYDSRVVIDDGWIIHPYNFFATERQPRT